MAPSLHTARTRLSYPLYGADFDPLNQDFLLVGGGGGSSSTGVPNKLSLIDCSRATDLQEVVDVELSKTEDSVMSLAVAQSSETSLTAYAGINNSTADQVAGKNEHLRSFRIDLPRRRKAGEGPPEENKEDAVEGRTEALGRTQFFRTQTGRDEVYQRIVRLSPLSQDASKPRVTAIASGLAHESEIVLLKAGLAPGSGNEIARLNLGNKEAVDLDFAPASALGEEDGGMQYTMAYCTDYDVRMYRLSAGKEGIKTQMTIVYTTPDAQGKGPRPKFRALRFLSPKHILLLQNLAGGKGAELLILRRHKTGTSAVISLQKRLSKNTKAATGLDVCILSESPIGDRQILVAVAAQNGSIEILRLDFSKRTGLSSFFPYTVLKDVHSGAITKIVFSTFVPPALPVTKDTRPQSVKLASVSVTQNLVVHTLPLRPFPPPPSKSPRYVLIPPGNSDILSTMFSVFMAVLVIGIAALLLQIFSEIRGAVPPMLGASDWLPANVKDRIARPYIFLDGMPNAEGVKKTAVDQASGVSDLLQENEYYTSMLADATGAVKDLPSSVTSAVTALTDLVAEQATAAAEAAQGTKQKAIVVRDEGLDLSTEVHNNAELVKEETLKKWEDLKEHEKVGWRKRLIAAGHWTADQGESVLKGVFFSELGAIAAQIL